MDPVFKSFFACLVSKNNNVELAKQLLPVVQTVLYNYSKLVNKVSWAQQRFNYNNTYGAKSVGFHTHKSAKPLLDYIKIHANEFLKKTGYKPVHPSRLVIDMFVSEMQAGSYHQTHVHPGSELAGVFYLQCPEHASPLTINDPRGYAMYNPPLKLEKIIETDYNMYESEHIPPQQGDLVIFNSWLPHEVIANSDKLNDKRITVVFNIQVI